MLVLTELPPEILLKIAEQLIDDPLSVSEADEIHGALMFRKRGGPADRLKDLKAYCETCWLVRVAVGPLLFKRIRLNNREAAQELTNSDWDWDVQVMTICLQEFADNESNYWADALLLFNVLAALPNLRHWRLELDRAKGQEITLAILATLLAPPPVLELAPSTPQVPCLEKIESFFLVFTCDRQHACHPRFLESSLPLLDRLLGLKHFALCVSADSHYLGIKEPPQLEILLQHLPAGVESLLLDANWSTTTPRCLELINHYCPNLKRVVLDPPGAMSPESSEVMLKVLYRLSTFPNLTQASLILPKRSGFDYVSQIQRVADSSSTLRYIQLLCITGSQQWAIWRSPGAVPVVRDYKPGNLRMMERSM